MQATLTNEVIFERGLPQSPDSEKLVLGSIMSGVMDIGRVSVILQADDFSVEARRIIYRALLDLDAAGSPMERSIVAQYLHQSGKLQAVGGLSALLELESSTMPALVEQQARMVRDKAILRRLYLELDKLASEISVDGATSVTAALGRIESFTEDLAGRMTESRGLGSIEQFIVASGLNPYEWLADRSAKMAVENPIVGMRELLDGYRAGELVIVAARPGCGKTALAGQIVEYSCRSGVGTAFYSLEMAAPQIISRLVCGRANVNSRALRKDELNDDGRQRVSKEFAEVFEWPLLLADKMAISVAGMRSTLRPLVAAGKIGLLVVDYLGLLVGNARAENRNQELSEISRSMKRLARELNIPVIALHQLSRDVEKRGGEPKLTDLRDSGSIEQDADIVVLIHTKESEAYQADYRGVSSWRKPCDLIVAKQRNGATGKYAVDFVPRVARFVAKDDI